MGFSSPVTPSALALAQGAAVITDPATNESSLFSSLGVTFVDTGTHQLGTPGSTFYCGDFDNLQAFIQRVAGTGSLLVQFNWFLDALATTVLGQHAVQLPPDTTAFIDTIPVIGPYLKVFVTPTVATDVAKIVLSLRKGWAGMAGSVGDGIVISGQDLGLAANGGNSIHKAGVVMGGPATLGVWTNSPSWYVVMYTIGSTGLPNTYLLGTSQTSFGVALPITLPLAQVALSIVNTHTVAHDFYTSVVAATRR